jgi:ADP-ribose pyrophosphatase YjhB (NUDIX family)
LGAVAHNYHYCVKCGSRLQPRVIEGRAFEACSNDDFVLWHDPKVVTSVVVEMEGGVLLGRRSIEPGLGLWCLPGGFVNDDEHPEAAAVRECREEIVARVDIISLISVYHIAKQTAPSMVGIAYRARPAAGETPEAGGEMSAVGVFSAESLPRLAFPSHRQILDEYFAERPASAAPPSTSQARSRPPRTR